MYPFWSNPLVLIAMVRVPVGYFLGPQLDYLSLSYDALLPRQWLSFSTYVRQVPYQVQVFNVDPLILYFRVFLSKDEINPLLMLRCARIKDKFEVSRLWPDEVGYVDLETRVSETAPINDDDIVCRIKQRATTIIGWRNNSTRLQRLKVQRYGFNGFYTFHYDWDGDSKVGNRMTTFMVYLVDDCAGGGTNFPRVEAPRDQRWYDVIVCDGDEDDDGYAVVTFKPIAGSAVYWENFHPNGTPHTGTRHAGLPVKSGEKLGLNIWSWDTSWRPKDKDGQL